MRMHGSSYRRMTFVLTAICLMASASRTPLHAGVDSPRVVILGSSTAAGANATPLSNSWVSKFTTYLAAQEPASSVTNLAVGGYTTFNIMPTGSTPPAPWNTSAFAPVATRNITAALSLDPNLIIINLPTNDGDLHVPIELQMANYAAIITAAAAQHVPVWIATPQPRTNGDATARALLRAMVDATFEAFPDRTIDFWTDIADADGRILPVYDSDQVHLNNAGHALLSERAIATVNLTQPAEPFVAMHPRAHVVTEGDPVSFLAIGSWSGPLQYQWQRDGFDLPGETSPVLAFTAVSLADSGALFRCVITDGATNAVSNAARLTVITPVVPPSATIISDDFSGSALDMSVWQFKDPLHDATLSFTGTGSDDAWLNISVPGGVNHDLWTNTSEVVQILQQFPNSDFEIEVKFSSTPSQKYQMQGLVVQRDSANLVRFDVVHQEFRPHVFAATFKDGIPTVRKDSTLGGLAPRFLRLKREGSIWTGSFSFDGTEWVTAARFSFSLVTTAGGVFAGNAGETPEASPAFTAQVDYFFNTAAPVVPEDPVIVPDAPVAISPASGSADLPLLLDLDWTSTGTTGDSLMVVCDTTTWDAPLLAVHLPPESKSYHLTGLVRGVTYHWRVRSSHPGAWGAWSEAFSFSTIPPVLVLSDSLAIGRTTFTPGTVWANPPSDSTEDWSYDVHSIVPVHVGTAHPVTFSACSLTVHWDPTRLAWNGLDTTGALIQGALAYQATLDTVAGTVRLSATFSDTMTMQPFTQTLARVLLSVRRPGRSTITASDVAFAAPLGGSTVTIHAEADTFTVAIFLGDIAAPGGITTRGDGVVGFDDLNVWSLSYWSTRPPAGTIQSAYQAKCDIGPTLDGTPYSMPMADGVIDFDDLMIMALMYGTTGPAPVPKTVRTGSVPLIVEVGASRSSGDTTILPVFLRGTDAGLHGLSLRFPGIAHRFAGLLPGALLQAVAPSPFVYTRAGEEDLEVHIAAPTGSGQGIPVNGELFTLRLISSGTVVAELEDARDGRNASLLTTGSGEPADARPTEYALGQNYPNPFNPSTRIEFTLPDRQLTTVAIHNVLGQQIAILVNEVRDPGKYTVIWNAAGLPSGVYLCRMTSGGFVSTKRMILIK